MEQNQTQQLLVELDQLAQELNEEIAAFKERDTKAGAKRIRKLTLDITKVGKEFRKLSVVDY